MARRVEGPVSMPDVVSVIKGDNERLAAYAKRADFGMLVLAFVFLAVWSARIAFAEFIPGAVRATLLTVQGLVWLAFIIDLGIRVALSGSRARYLVKHPLDVIAVAIPAARPLKILSVFTQGTMLASRKGAVKSTQAVLLSVVLLMWIGAVAILDAERGHVDAQITNFGDALWWALVTMTTVGYGDFAPVTVEGRIVATVLMLVGIALIGVITATVAAWFVNLTQGEEEERSEVTRAELLDRIADLEAKIDAIAERRAPGASGLPHQTPAPLPPDRPAPTEAADRDPEAETGPARTE